MFDRIILVIDDNKRTESIYIRNYQRRLDEMKTIFPEWSKYNFILKHLDSMQAAKDYLLSNSIVDVLIVDYDFGSERTFSNGSEFIRFVRENVNKQCRIIFYTMQETNNIERKELISLINSDVYKMIDKSTSIDDFSKEIFNAATKCNPIVLSLERFFVKYSNMLKNTSYTFDGEDISIEDIITHIRMDDEIGRCFIEKLLYKSILKEIDLGE